MRKLKLELDHLSVESFDAAPDETRSRRGTVWGRLTGMYDGCTGAGRGTLGGASYPGPETCQGGDTCYDFCVVIPQDETFPC